MGSEEYVYSFGARERRKVSDGIPRGSNSGARSRDTPTSVGVVHVEFTRLVHPYQIYSTVIKYFENDCMVYHYGAGSARPTALGFYFRFHFFASIFSHWEYFSQFWLLYFFLNPKSVLNFYLVEVLAFSNKRNGIKCRGQNTSTMDIQKISLSYSSNKFGELNEQ